MTPSNIGQDMAVRKITRHKDMPIYLSYAVQWGRKSVNEKPIMEARAINASVRVLDDALLITRHLSMEGFGWNPLKRIPYCDIAAVWLELVDLKVAFGPTATNHIVIHLTVTGEPAQESLPEWLRGENSIDFLVTHEDNVRRLYQLIEQKVQAARIL